MSTQALVPEPNIDEAYRLIIPAGGGPSIRIYRAALRQIEVQIQIGVKALRGRGVEIGGLLVGPGIDWSARGIAIDGFVPVEIEYRWGPTFKPSDTDIERFKQALADSGDRVIGYFRSHIRDDSRVRAEDVRLLTELFPLDSCYIPIEAGPNSTSIVNVYQVQQGMPSVLLEFFPLKESGSAYEQPIAADVSEVPAPALEPAPTLEPAPVEPALVEPALSEEDSPVSEQTAELATFSEMPLPATRFSKRRKYWIAALATIAAGTATYALLREAPRIPQAQRAIDRSVDEKKAETKDEKKAEPPAVTPPSAPEQNQPAAAASTPPAKAKSTRVRSKAGRSKKAAAKKARPKKAPAASIKQTVPDR